MSDDGYLDVAETTYFDVEPRPAGEDVYSSLGEVGYFDPSFAFAGGERLNLDRERSDSFYADFSSLAQSNEAGEFNQRLLVANPLYDGTSTDLYQDFDAPNHHEAFGNQNYADLADFNSALSNPAYEQVSTCGAAEVCAHFTCR